MACTVTFLSRLCTPQRQDTINTLLKRIAGSTSGGGGGTAFQDLSGNGSPVGVVTPDAVNQKYRDSLNDTYWWATGLTNTDWQQFV